MALLLDTGILYAYYDRSDAWHAAAAELIGGEPGELLVPAPVVPEVDHLLGARLGRAARELFYRGLVEASYLVVELPQERVARVAEIDRQFVDLDLGFVDSAVVALAELLGIARIATTDRRRFGPLARAFRLELLPVAAPSAPPAASRARRVPKR